MVLREFRPFLLVLCLVCTHTFVQAQPVARETVANYLNDAKSLMSQERYEEANIIFRKMLALNTTLPEDVSYLFSETLYFLGQYKNSQNFLTKYLTLTGRTGNYYEEATALQDRLEEEMLAVVNCHFCNGLGMRLVPCTTCQEKGTLDKTCPECRGLGNTRCQKCLGEGVVIYLDQFGSRKYQTCDNCDGQGYHSCNVCEGAKLIQSPCPTCLGSKTMQSGSVCTHEPIPTEEHNHEGHDHK